MDEDRIRQLNQQVAEMATKAREASAQLEKIAIEATSRNRAVIVTVGSGGVLKSVKPGPASSGVNATQMCAGMMEAYGKAARQAAQEASELMLTVTGRDTEVMKKMREAMPPADDEDER